MEDYRKIAIKLGQTLISKAPETREDVERMLPELKESEDEKIRKWLIALIKSNEYGSISNVGEMPCPKLNVLDWLEKQGEQKIVDEIAKEVCKNKALAVAFLKSAGIMNEKGELAEQYRQDEQVEPKFKNGNWIVYKDAVWKVCNISLQNYYELLKINNEVSTRLIEDVDENAHFWTIKDAKDGDVLRIRNLTFIFQEITNNNVCHKDVVVAYCSYEDNDDGFGVCGPDCITDLEIITPAAKEQRDLLFRKMKEAGYEWDAEKKELKKIEQKLAEWSEEDEKMIWAIPLIIKSYPNQEMFYGYSKEKLISWFKSLKDRVQPERKWSAEDSRILYNVKAYIGYAAGQRGVRDELFKEANEWLNSLPIGFIYNKNYNEDMVTLLVGELKQIASDNNAPEQYQVEINWLKSLRPQSTQIWDSVNEGDFRFLISIIEELFKGKDKVTLCGDTVCAHFTKQDIIERLESLKPQNTWKPSDEQMDALHYVTNFDYGGHKATLVSLYEQLKKLKG